MCENTDCALSMLAMLTKRVSAGLWLNGDTWGTSSTAGRTKESMHRGVLSASLASEAIAGVGGMATLVHNAAKRSAKTALVRDWFSNSFCMDDSSKTKPRVSNAETMEPWSTIVKKGGNT
eukprot:CAMPEP_0172752680 /NCGR_PEP_ID=MMETSP1074-20121228/154284_1 /TAXON_ID=2916 /ORGANISM="Ceratium fusus, Strain PA161109" /LENGTH=119 /DNA_ID=CAMNT_0013585217 /DNA_START=165 /DNA_END=521 /DNA_ORIENTATION=-